MARPFFRVIVVLACLAFAVLFTVAAIDTVRGSVPADPVEITVLREAGRIAHPEVKTVAPPGPVPIALLPAFPALVASVLGLEPPRLEIVRAMALAATLLTALVVGLVVRLETRSWTLALAATSFALAGQGLFTTAPGVARPEAFLVLLVLLGYATLRYFPGSIGALIAALPLAAACFVGPAALAFLGVALLAQAFEDRTRLVVLAITSVVLLLGGWFTLPALLGSRVDAGVWVTALDSLRFSPADALRFATTHLLGRLGLFTLVAVLSFALSTQLWQGTRGIWMWLGVTAIAGGILSSQSVGADPSALLPGIVVLALLGTLSLQRIAHHLSDSDEYEGPGGEGVILAGLGLQCLVFLSAAMEASWVTTIALAFRS